MMSRAWGEVARTRITRPLHSDAEVICVGGSTLGGSGKTPLVIACARLLMDNGVNVAVIGHAYRARPPVEPRVVTVDDDVELVGDEAIECARAGLVVLVARSRQRAIDAARADVIILDGPLRIESRALSLLAVAADDPWGNGECPPLGNLRAPKTALTGAADHVVPVCGTSRGVRIGTRLVAYAELDRTNIGLATGIARPERVVRMLASHGIVPARTKFMADHSSFRHPDRDGLFWLTTAKDAARHAQANAIDYHFDLPTWLDRELGSRFSFRF